MPRILQQENSVAQKRELQTGLWILPLTDNTRQPKTNTTADNYKRMNETHKQYAHNMYAMTSKASLVQYLHQAAFSPPKATLLKAVHNNQFVTWPGLTVKAVKKYLPEFSLATDKGHMKWQKRGIRSTKEKIMTALSTIETARDINPPMEKKHKTRFLFTMLYWNQKREQYTSTTLVTSPYNL